MFPREEVRRGGGKMEAGEERRTGRGEERRERETQGANLPR